MKQIMKDFRSLRKIFSNKDFWFVLTVYPIGFFAYTYVTTKMKKTPLLTGETQEFYSLLCILIAGFFTVYTVYEVIDKRLLYKNQGDKLKLKQDEKEWQKTIK